MFLFVTAPKGAQRSETVTQAFDLRPLLQSGFPMGWQ